MGWRTAQHPTSDHSVPTRSVVHMVFKYMKTNGRRGREAHETTPHGPTPQLNLPYHGPKKQGDRLRDEHSSRRELNQREKS